MYLKFQEKIKIKEVQQLKTTEECFPELKTQSKIEKSSGNSQ